MKEMEEETKKDGNEIRLIITPDDLHTVISECMDFVQARLEQEIASEEAAKNNCKYLH